MEHCSSEIAPPELNEDEKQESASLLFRFHHVGWLHKSFAERSLLWQLIDFCRSRMIETSNARMGEEEETLRLLRLRDELKNCQKMPHVVAYTLFVLQT